MSKGLRDNKLNVLTSRKGAKLAKKTTALRALRLCASFSP